MKNWSPAFILGIAAAVATASGERTSLWAHDALGELYAARLVPAVVVYADTSPESALGAVKRAGARDVWTVGLDPLPGSADGAAVPLFDGHRVLPEYRRSVRQLRASQLGAGTPTALLEGFSVVLAPGDPTPARRKATTLAAGMGSDRFGRALPLWLAALLVGLCGALSAQAYRKGPVHTAVTASLHLGALGVIVAVIRSFGVDLPFLGMAFAIGAGATWRLWTLVSYVADAYAAMQGTPAAGTRPVSQPWPSTTEVWNLAQTLGLAVVQGLRRARKGA